MRYRLFCSNFFLSFLAVFYKGKGIKVNMPERVKFYDNIFANLFRKLKWLKNGRFQFTGESGPYSCAVI